MTGSNGRTLAKDLHQLLKNVHGMSGGQVVITDWEDDLTSIKMTITPTDGYYKGGEFVFEVSNKKTKTKTKSMTMAENKMHSNHQSWIR